MNGSARFLTLHKATNESGVKIDPVLSATEL